MPTRAAALALLLMASAASSATQCTDDGFCERAAGMLHADSRAIWQRGGDAVLVGARGSVIRALNGVWQPREFPTTATLSAVSAVDANDVWVAGENGSLLHFDGEAWTTVSAPTTATVVSIHAGPKHLWLLTSDGALLQRTDGAFVAPQLPLTQRWQTLLATDDGLLLASATRLLRLQGEQWRDLTPPRGLEHVIWFGRGELWNYSVDGSQRWDGERWKARRAQVPTSACPADDGRGHNFTLEVFHAVSGEVYLQLRSCRGSSLYHLRLVDGAISLGEGRRERIDATLAAPPGVRHWLDGNERAHLPWQVWSVWRDGLPQLGLSPQRTVYAAMPHGAPGPGGWVDFWHLERGRWVSDGQDLDCGNDADAGVCTAMASLERATSAFRRQPPGDQLRAVASVRDGTFVLGHSGGLWKFADGVFTPAGVGLPSLVDLRRDSAGVVWALGAHGEIFSRAAR